MHGNFKTVQNATPAQLTALENSYTNEAALALTYRSRVVNLFGSEYAGFDNNAWGLIGPSLGDCDPDYGCDPCDPNYGSCGAGYNPGYYFTAYASTQIVIDAATGSFEAHSEQHVFASVGTVVSDGGACIASVTVSAGTLYGNAPQWPVCSGSANYTIARIYGVATQPGTYVATGTTQPFGGTWEEVKGGPYTISVPPLTTNNSQQFNPVACSPPTIDSILVNGEPTSGLIIPTTNGTMTIFGACLDSTTQVSIQNAGSSNAVTLGTVTPSQWGSVSVQYSVAAGSAPETAVVTVSTSTGSATAPVQVVPTLPYISSVVPDAWPTAPSGSPPVTTLVAINGAGFGDGLIPGTVTLTAQDSSYPVGVAGGYVTWSDSMIVLNVQTTPGDPDLQTVDVAVTAGNYGLNFQQNRGVGLQAHGTATTVRYVCFDERDFEIAEYYVCVR
jgi:hypothetical protein